MSNDPTSVSLNRVVEFLRDIGLDPVNAEDVRSVHFESGLLTVVRYRRDERGKLVIARNELLTETTTIRIDGTPPAPVIIDITTHGDSTPTHVVGERYAPGEPA